MAPGNGQPGGAGAAQAVDPFELLAIAGSLNSTLDLDYLLNKIGIASEQLLQSEASSILLVDKTKKFLYFKVATGTKGAALKKITVPIGKGIAGWVAEKRQHLIVNDVSKDPRFTGMVDKSSGFVTRSIMAVPMVTRGELIGVAEVLNKTDPKGYTDDDLQIFTSLSSLASVAIANTKLIQDQKNFFSHVLELLANAIEISKPRMSNHPQRAAQLACMIGRYMGISRDDYQALYYAGLLHDIGYVGGKNPRLLENFGLLNFSEELHPVVSEKMLEGINILWAAVPLVRHHHERFDGTGFPDKLKGEQIPLGSRILCLVEAIEEVRMSTGLKGSDLKSRAVNEAKNGSSSRFDPKVVETFLELVEEEERVLE